MMTPTMTKNVANELATATRITVPFERGEVDGTKEEDTDGEPNAGPGGGIDASAGDGLNTSPGDGLDTSPGDASAGDGLGDASAGDDAGEIGACEGTEEVMKGEEFVLLLSVPLATGTPAVT